jgi:hypothetical protein
MEKTVMWGLLSKTIDGVRKTSLPNIDAKVGTTHTGGSHVISNNHVIGGEIIIGNKTNYSNDRTTLLAVGAIGAALVYGTYVYRNELAEAMGIRRAPSADR